MSYQIKFTETTNPAKPALVVDDQTLNTVTSIKFPGKNYSGYSAILGENFLHLLENFARSTAPGTLPSEGQPVQGQLWYDTTVNVKLLKVFDGITWTAAGSVKKAAIEPLVNNSTIGDLWVNTSTQQLFLFSGSTWLLVGPQYSAGLKTGPTVEVIVDTENVSHTVISLYCENYLIAIISKASFIPKLYISGYTIINEGINLNSIDATLNKLWGTAKQADALVVSGSAVPSSNFLRTDVTVPSAVQLSIRTDNGINIGSDLSFSITTDVTSSILTSKTSGKNIAIKVNTTDTVIHIDSTLQVGINNISPAEALDVNGNIKTNGNIFITGTTDSTGIGIGSFQTAGGLYVAKQANFNSNVSLYGTLTLNKLDDNSDPISGTVIVPGYDTSVFGSVPLYDIGSATQRFRNIYAQQFEGDFTGSFSGNLTGNISGTASRLASATEFSLVGDVTSNIVAFTGQSQSYTAIFNTSITQDIITNKPNVETSISSDKILIYRSGSNAGLKNVTKQQFLSNVATMPIGAMMPFAGTVLPPGYLLCDGSELKIAEYSNLFEVIGYLYKDYNSLVGSASFALPDMRGRHALGRDNMNNNLTIPSREDPTISIDAHNGNITRVTDASADTVGNFNGAETVTLSVTNIPEHKHNMRTNTAQYYAVGLPGGSIDVDADPNLGMPNESTGYGLRNSGGILVPENTTLGQPIKVMNPYLTINYIIFTGVL